MADLSADEPLGISFGIETLTVNSRKDEREYLEARNRSMNGGRDVAFHLAAESNKNNNTSEES